VIRGERSAPESVANRPVPTLLAPTERRRAPDTVAVALEVASRACEAAGRDAKDLPAVFASTHGDLAISDYMCTVLASTPHLLSPIKFHNSVHNAAAGYWSIGSGSYQTYTAISAHRFTFATGLLEAACQALCEQRPILYCAFDIEAKGALATMAASKGLLGLALVIGHQPAAGAKSLALQVSSTASAAPTPATSDAYGYVQDNALAPCFAFVETLASGAGEAAFALGERCLLQMQLS
jgi:hypothetical protein